MHLPLARPGITAHGGSWTNDVFSEEPFRGSFLLPPRPGCACCAERGRQGKQVSSASPLLIDWSTKVWVSDRLISNVCPDTTREGADHHPDTEPSFKRLDHKRTAGPRQGLPLACGLISCSVRTR